jgi:hypothetical protein
MVSLTPDIGETGNAADIARFDGGDFAAIHAIEGIKLHDFEVRGAAIFADIG